MPSALHNKNLHLLKEDSCENDLSIELQCVNSFCLICDSEGQLIRKWFWSSTSPVPHSLQTLSM